MSSEQKNHLISRERQLFDAVASLVQSSAAASSSTVSDTLRLRFYGLYKRVTVGTLHGESYARTAKPSRFNIVAWYKYEAWGKCDHLTDAEAMMEYVRLAAKQDNDTAAKCRALLVEYEQELVQQHLCNNNNSSSRSSSSSSVNQHKDGSIEKNKASSQETTPIVDTTTTLYKQNKSFMKPFVPRGQLDIQWTDLLHVLIQIIFYLLLSVLSRLIAIVPSSSSISLWIRHQDSVAKAWRDTHTKYSSQQQTEPAGVITALSVRSILDLYLSVRQYPPGSEIIITPPINIEGMIRIIQYHNLHIVPVDVQLDPADHSFSKHDMKSSFLRFKIDVKDIQKRITPRTVAIMIVHPFGHVCLEEQDMVDLKSIAKQSSQNIDILEDCAECYSGNLYQGSPSADILFYSLGTIKTTTTLGGGIAVIQQDLQLAAKMKEWQCRMYSQQTHMEYGIKVIQLTCLHGISQYPILCGMILQIMQTFGFDYDQTVTNLVRGFPVSTSMNHESVHHPNHNLMRNIRRRPCLALLSLIRRRLFQWKQTHAIVQSRIHRCCNMNQYLLNSNARIQLPVSATNVENHLYWLYPILVGDPTRTELEMRNRGFDVPKGASQMNCITEFLVGTQVDFCPCPNAEWMMQHILYLPIASRSISKRVIDELCIALEESTNTSYVPNDSKGQMQMEMDGKQRNMFFLFICVIIGLIVLIRYPQTIITITIGSIVTSLYFLWVFICVLILLRVFVGKSYIDESNAYSKYCCMASESIQDEPQSTLEGDSWTMGLFKSHQQSNTILSLEPLRVPYRERKLEEASSTQSKNRILLTGATGFIGSLVLRNLLLNRNRLDIDGGIVIICRSRKNITSIERVQKLLGDDMFSFLSAEEKTTLIVVFDGDVTLPKLGLSEADYYKITHEFQISHIIHCAASVSFTLSLPEAASSNITPALQIQALRKEMKNKVAKFIYVSTAFVHGQETGTPDKPLQEELYSLKPFDPVLIYESMVTTQIYATEAMKKLGFPNTYSLSKCVCEHLLSLNESEGNTIIIRPSIVGPSVQEPYEGWSGFYPATLIASGCLYYMYQYLLWNFSDKLVPVIPVDIVAKFIVAKAFASDEDGSVSPRSQTSSDVSDDIKIDFEMLPTQKIKRNDGFYMINCNNSLSSCIIHNVAWNSSSSRESQFSWYDFARAIVQNGSAKGLFSRPVAYLGYTIVFKILPYVKPSHNVYRALHNGIVNGSLLFIKTFSRIIGISSKDLKKINRFRPFMDLPILFVPYTQSSFYFESELTTPRDFNSERYMFSCVLAAEKFVRSYRNKIGDCRDTNHIQNLVVSTKPQLLTDLLWAWTQPRGNIAIRIAAFLFRQILSKTGVDLTVDINSFSQLSQAIAEIHSISKGPLTIVLAPTHRSLYDFLLLSYIIFSLPELQLDLPYIAAADEFSLLPVFGWFAQRCGAFFVKRGLGSVDNNLDQVIAELKKRDNNKKRPFFVELFVEGKRSRDRVFIKPKTGVLKCLHSLGNDLIILPIAINYEYLPDQRSLLGELTDQANATISVGKLLSWLRLVVRGRVQLGKIHISASRPLKLQDCPSNWNSVVELIQLRQMQNWFVSDYHIKCGAIALDLDPSVVRQGLAAAGCRFWPLSKQCSLTETLSSDIDINDAWHGFLQCSHLLSHFISPKNSHWSKEFTGLSTQITVEDLCFNTLSERINQILFDVDTAIDGTKIYLRNRGHFAASPIHVLQYAKQLQPSLPVLLLRKALSIRPSTDDRTSDPKVLPITTLLRQETLTSTTLVKAQFSRKKEGGDDESFGAWGFRDTAFTICTDSDCNLSVKLTGERYKVSGRHFSSLMPFMEEEIGVKVDLHSVSIPSAPNNPSISTSMLTADHLKMLKNVLNNEEDRIVIDSITRARHGTGHSLEDMFLIRNDLLSTLRLPDAVVYPKNEEEIYLLLQLAARAKLAIIPFGGGTNVTHAIRCPSIDSEPRPILSLDLKLMHSILSVHDEDGIAHVQAGITGKSLSIALASRGYTMGHEPDSYEFSTVGGWIATNASGMKQNKYGNIEQIVKDVRVVSSKGFIWQSAGPNSSCSGRSSIGSSLVSLMIGSEGSLGIITSAKIKIWPLPKLQIFDSILFPSQDDGIRFVRDISKMGPLKPASVRLLDNKQFRLGHAMIDQGGSLQKIFTTLKNSLLKILFSSFVTTSTVCCTLSFEGSPDDVEVQRKIIRHLSSKHDGLSSGGAVGESGYNLTFTIAYLRDFALTYGLLAESFETFAPWSKVSEVIHRTTDRVYHEHRDRALPGKPFISSRITQLYDEGVCIYFYLCIYINGVDNPQDVFAGIERAAREEILNCGGTLSHHHGIGKLRSHYLKQINSDVLGNVLKNVKNSFDPDNVLIGNGCYYNE